MRRALMRSMPHVPEEMERAVVYAQWHMIVGWAVVAPIVTLVIATGATQGIRAALTTVAGTTLGNAVLLAAIAFGLSWVLKNAVVLFEILRWGGAPEPACHKP